MGIGTGLGARGRRGRPARRRHRPQHRRRQRRAHHHRTHHHRAGVHHRTGIHHNHHGIHHQFRLIFTNRQRGARTHGHHHRTTSSSGRATASTSTGNSPCTSRLPAGCIPAVVTVILMALIIVPFAVPAVPFPIGIAFTLFFVVIVVVPQLVNIVQTYKARRSEPDVEAPPADGDEDVDLGLPEFFREAVHYNADIGNSQGTNGQQSAEYSYDPPPSFSEATAQQVPDIPGDAEPKPELPTYPVPGSQFPYPPAGISPDHPDDGLPPPPSYEEVINSGATYEPAEAEES